MKTIKIVVCSFGMLLLGCNKNPSLEKYFVENSENPDFVNLDLSPSMLNTNKLKLTDEQTDALKGFDKMNILVFKKTDKNIQEFDVERKKMSQILKDEKYQELMKFGMGKEGASISYVGEDDHISEFVISGNKVDIGFAVVRITGKDMNPNNIMKMVGMLQNGNLDIKALQPIMEMLKN